jgi:acetoin utilization deacetylase AcuC-like enzyme
MPSPIALVSHPGCSRHDTGEGHFESRHRLPALLDAARADVELSGVLREQLGEAATEEDLLRVHSAGHVSRVRGAAEEARRLGGLVWLDEDTVVSAGSFDAALAAAGCVITAAASVLDGSVRSAFALSRPPGHHATRESAMGFCLVNNVAVAVRWMQARRRVGRVLVVDWDAHHGNGTQDLFYEDPTVYVLSLHLGADYPGTGATGERGAGAGAGTTRNVPLPRGTSAADYRRHFLEALDSAFSTFAPDVVVVSAGFDCLAGEALGGFLLQPRDLHQLTTDLLERLPVSANGRVIAALEGGYDTRCIGKGLVEVLRALGGLPPGAARAS